MSHEMNSSFHADIYYTEHKILVGQPVLPKQCPSFLLFWALSKKKKKLAKRLIWKGCNNILVTEFR